VHAINFEGLQMKWIKFLAGGVALALHIVAFAATAPKPAKPALPAYVTLPATVGVIDDIVTYEDFAEFEFYKSANEDTTVKQGKHWYATLELKKPPDAIEGKAVWAMIKPSLLAGGWTIPVEFDSNPFSAVMRYQKNGKDVWGYVKIFGTADMRLNLIEVGQPVSLVTINPPAATPEKFTVEKGDYPYLPPLPGSKLGVGSYLEGPLQFTFPGSDEIQIVGKRAMIKYYPNVPNVSTVAFATAYRNALTKAGWTIISPGANIKDGNTSLTAHYASNGRDIWAALLMGGEEYTIKVADVGAESDIERQFAKDCHVALYGVVFDFNKAVLKPESDSVLQRVLAFANKDAALKLEVQGHTDNVGGDAYNQQLSEARSKSVMAWLVQHGVASNRLSFKGFGKTRPVASNDDDEGRAKNRRVEIARPGCTK
jgi:OOP family OmpA-OmpF porin